MTEKFEIQTYIGREPEPDEPSRRPPRSAKLVAAISWSWSPVHSRSSIYWLCTNQRRLGWILWEQSSDWETGKPIYEEIAYGEPWRGIDPRSAAQRMVTEAWKDEWQMWESPGPGGWVDQPGLLNADDIEHIEKAAFAEFD